MGIIQNLGLNFTIFIQLGIFLVTYFFLYKLIFKPYYRAYEKRTESTLGSESISLKYKDEIEGLESEYQLKARDLYAQITEVYKEINKETLDKKNKIINEAQSRSKKTLDTAREEIRKQKQVAEDQIELEAHQLAQVISERLLS